MKQQNYSKGRAGEEIAKKYLEEKGFVWIDSNYENKIGEIDLIMIDKDWLVFVEVKYKKTDRLGIPYLPHLLRPQFQSLLVPTPPHSILLLTLLQKQ